MGRVGSDSDPKLSAFKSRALQLIMLASSVTLPVLGGGVAIYRGMSAKIDTLQVRMIRIESQLAAQKDQTSAFWSRDWPNRGKRLDRLEARLRRLEANTAALRAVVHRRLPRLRR